MKKLILTLISILLFIYVALSLLSFRGDYRPERDLWKINNTLSYIASHQESTPDFEMDQVAKKYQGFIKKYNKSIYAKRAQLMLGDLYSLRKNYAQARSEYQKAIGQDKEVSAQAEFAIAKTYEIEGRWDQALPVYKTVVQNYPLTNSGFFTPMYLTTHVSTSGEEQRAYTSEAYGNALVFYRKIVAKHPKSKLEYDGLRMIAVCQLNLKEWSGAVDTMGEIILKYPIGAALKESVSAINIICVTRLHDYDKAMNIYKKFIQKYPDYPADPLLKKMIKSLQLLKGKSLVIKSSVPVVSKK